MTAKTQAEASGSLHGHGARQPSGRLSTVLLQQVRYSSPRTFYNCTNELYTIHPTGNHNEDYPGQDILLTGEESSL